MQTCCPEDVVHHNLSETSDGFIGRLRYEDTLASRQAAGLEYDLETTCLDVVCGLAEFFRSKYAETGRRNRMAIHKCFRERFGALHTRSQCGWAEHWNPHYRILISMTAKTHERRDHLCGSVPRRRLPEAVQVRVRPRTPRKIHLRYRRTIKRPDLPVPSRQSRRGQGNRPREAIH